MFAMQIAYPWAIEAVGPGGEPLNEGPVRGVPMSHVEFKKYHYPLLLSCGPSTRRFIFMKNVANCTNKSSWGWRHAVAELRK